MTPPRTSMARSSLAIALQDYKGPVRPGIALTIAAVALLGSIVVGFAHIVMLGSGGVAISRGQQTIRTLHRYNAALEVWRRMAILPDSQLQFPSERRLRDSIQSALSADLLALSEQLSDSAERELITRIVADLRRGSEGTGAASVGLGDSGREAMLELAGRQETELFEAVGRYRRSQLFAAVLIGLTVVAAGALIIPMSWAYIRYKRGIPPGM